MKIETQYKPPPIAGKTANTPKTASATPSQSAEVRLSEAAAQLAAADDSAPMDLERIEEIKQAITEGRFKINAEAIADGLIATSRQLIASQGQH